MSAVWASIRCQCPERHCKSLRTPQTVINVIARRRLRQWTGLGGRWQGVSTKLCSLRALAQSDKPAGIDEREAHKIFDEAVIHVKAGDGGEGEIASSGGGRWVPNFKYRPGSSLPKQIWLPASKPADGCDGGNVVLVCDAAVDSLLHLHQQTHWTAKTGAKGNPAEGTGGPKSRKNIQRKTTPSLKISVPPGTVVLRKKGGVKIGELLQPGEKLLVAHGGRGGIGVVMPSRKQKVDSSRRQRAHAEKLGVEVVEVQDVDWKLDARGSEGEAASLRLQLRVVADVGLVGLPNAGKSSLLKALTSADPKVAPYPFTTLMPNLGVMQAGGDQELGIGGTRATLADLPGLIEGAHVGRGLGRMFLRHLSRTRAMLHVVDSSADDPACDYRVVREELRMYNPEYCSRPHVVIINKTDLIDADTQAALLQAVRAAANDFAGEHSMPDALPAAVVCTSAVTCEGLDDLQFAIKDVLESLDSGRKRRRGGDDYSWVGDDDVVDWSSSLSEHDDRF